MKGLAGFISYENERDKGAAILSRTREALSYGKSAREDELFRRGAFFSTGIHTGNIHLS
jgi:hypothetical protein